jgi:hypothetical protein
MSVGRAIRIVAEGQTLLKVTVLDRANASAARMIKSKCDMLQTTADQASDCVRQTIGGHAIQNLL